MKCGPIEIPDAIASALEADDLVIFAGAGVSNGKPAKLPLFKELAGEIAEHFRLPPLGANENPDQFLAQLKEDKKDVHSACVHLLRRAKVPNELHRLLLRLFHRSKHVRIVTTNFDPLFSLAAQELKLTVPVSLAPALPLGNDFEGIVHLHGAIADSKPERLVLTAKDLSQAYLIRGWARQFLLDLYAKHTLLFVGYSHEDILLQYLGYGLRSSSEKKRFAFAHSNHEKWIQWGITPIPFDVIEAPESERYRNLHNGLQAWLTEIERTPLESEARLDQILHSKAEPTPEDEDFLVRCLKVDSTAAQFKRYAEDTGLRWVEWLDRRGALVPFLMANRPIIPATTPDSLATAIVAQWLASRLLESKDGQGLSLVERHEGKIGREVWDKVAIDLSNKDRNLLRTKEGKEWLAFLLSTYRTAGSANLLLMVLPEAVRAKLWPAVVQIIDFMIRPEGRLMPEFPKQPYPRATLSVEVGSEAQETLYRWHDVVSPVLRRLATRLAPLFEEKIREAHELALLAGSATAHRMPALYARTHIEFDPHPYIANGVSVLLNLFAETLEALHKVRRGATEDWARRLILSGNPALFRFGLHVLKTCRSLTSVEKFEWMLTHDLFYSPVYGSMGEIYEIVESIYRHLPTKLKARVWREWESRLPKKTKKDIDSLVRGDAIDKACWHLAKKYRRDSLALRAKRRLERRNPKLAASQPWRPGEKVRMNVQPFGDMSPLSVAELKAKDPASALDLLRDFKDVREKGFSRNALLRVMTAVVAEDKPWGIRLLRALAKSRCWDVPLWSDLLQAFRLNDLPPEDQTWFLGTVFEKLVGIENHVDALARFICHGQTIEELRALDPSNLGARVKATSLLWPTARRTTRGTPKNLTSEKWLDASINRAPGWIVEFWTMNQQCVLERTKVGEPEWPEAIRPALPQILLGEIEGDLLALAYVASRIAFYRRVVPTWTKENVYACFDFKRMGEKAWVPWTALILYSGLSRDVALELKQLLREAFPILLTAEDKVVRELVLKIAAIAASGLFDPIADGWLQDFVLRLKPRHRAVWTNGLARELKRLLKDDSAAQWQAWIRSYVTDRINVQTPPIESDETEALIHLACSIPKKFVEAAAMLITLPPPKLVHFVPWEFAKSTLKKEEPAAYLALLNWMLGGASSHLLLNDDLEQLLEALPPKKELLPAWITYCQHLSKINAANARKQESDGRAYFVE